MNNTSPKHEKYGADHQDDSCILQTNRSSERKSHPLPADGFKNKRDLLFSD